MKHFPSLMGFLAVVFMISAASSVVTMPAVSSWYETIHKPSWTPPDWVFGPVWTFLYLLIAISGWLMWKKLPGTFLERFAHSAMVPYWLQLALNFAWSIIFFGFGQFILAAINIVVMLAAIAWNIAAFHKIDAKAAGLLIPYLLWVLYASTLNIGIVVLN